MYEAANDFNPNNTSLPFNLLAKSPYELNLNNTQRRDDLGQEFCGLAIPHSAATLDTPITGKAAGLVDDAAFSTSDLEKVLRAWDADAGTLPSRLWDCVNAFDPQKLLNKQYGDPYRVQSISPSGVRLGRAVAGNADHGPANRRHQPAFGDDR